MLNAISWQQFLSAVLLATVAWYAYVSLRFFRPQIAGFLKIQSSPQTLTPPIANKVNSVIGDIKPETDTGLFDPQDLVFGINQPDEISDQTILKGPADELLAEAETLVEAYATIDNKPEFLSLLKLLIDKYEVLRDEISLPVIMASLKSFAETRLPFQIEGTEWPTNF